MKQLLSFILLLLSLSLCAENEIFSYKLSTANGLPDNNIRTMAMDTNGMLYFNTQYTTYMFDGYTFRFVDDAMLSRIPEPLKRANGKDIDSEWSEDNRGNHYKVTPDGIITYKSKSNKVEFSLQGFDPHQLQLSKSMKVYVVTDIRGWIWISISGNGIFVRNPKAGTTRHITRHDERPLIDSDYIIYLMEDKVGNIWASQEHIGIVCFKVSTQKYENIRTGQPHEKTSNVRMMDRLSNGRIMFANNAGELFSADGNLHNIQKHDIGKNILTAFIDSKGRMWYGSRQNGASADGKWMANGRIESFLEDGRHRVWTCGLNNDVYVEDADSLRPVLAGLIPRQMILAHDGNIIAACDSGLVEFNPDKAIRNPKAYTFLMKRFTRNVFEDSRHNLWVGTGGRGMYLRKSGQKEFVHYTHEDGLPSNSINFVTEDSRHNIYIGTENGLVMYLNGKFRTVFVSNELLCNFCNENSYAFLDDGRLAIGTLDGIIIVSPYASADTRQIRHDISLTEMLINGTSVSADESTSDVAAGFLQHKKITLEHNQDNLTIYFSIFDYATRNTTYYSYRLEGYDKDWSPASNLNFASYRNLPSGTYSFHVRYMDEDGKWNESPYVQVIRIEPPLWATWWAIMLYIIAISVIIYFVYRYLRTTYQLKRDIAVEKQLTEYKLKFFTNISHEFRTPLTLIQNSMEKLSAIKDVPGEARKPISNMQRDVQRMMRLINQLLEFRRMQNNKLSLSLQQTDIISFLYNIWINFHDTAEKRRMNYSFLPEKKELQMYVDRGFVDKIFYNILSNAFKYTPEGGEIGVKVKTEDEHLAISVSDTGIGIPEDKQKEIFERFSTGKVNADSIGIGLHLTRELVRVHHGEITYSVNPGGGSIFVVTLPLDKSVYSEKDFMNEVPELNNIVKVKKEGYKTSEGKANVQPMNDKTVLIADDTDELRDMVEGELSSYFHIITTHDGQEALDKLTSADKLPDLVISDILMPRMSGIELTRKIRHDDRLKSIPVILLTSITDEEKRNQGIEAGADAFITKPFNVISLITQCAALIKGREVLQNAYSTEVKSKPVVKEVIKDEKDLRFVRNLNSAIHREIANPDLNVDSLAEQFGLGRTTFYNKVKSLTGKTPNEYINQRRLEAAAQMLRDTNLNVTEIAYKTGFSTPQYFARNFKKYFGVTPTEYVKGK